jgi:hypothetical protein
VGDRRGTVGLWGYILVLPRVQSYRLSTPWSQAVRVDKRSDTWEKLSVVVNDVGDADGEMMSGKSR